MQLTNSDVLKGMGYSDGQIAVRHLVEEFTNTVSHVVDQVRVIYSTDKNGSWGTVEEYVLSSFLDVVRNKKFQEAFKRMYGTIYNEATLDQIYLKCGDLMSTIIFIREGLKELSDNPLDKLLKTEGGGHKLSDEEVEEAHRKYAEENKYHFMDLSRLPPWGQTPKVEPIPQETENEAQLKVIREIVKDEVANALKEMSTAMIVKPKKKKWVKIIITSGNDKSNDHMEACAEFIAAHDVVDIIPMPYDRFWETYIIYEDELPALRSWEQNGIKKILKEQEENKDGN